MSHAVLSKASRCRSKASRVSTIAAALLLGLVAVAAAATESAEAGTASGAQPFADRVDALSRADAAVVGVESVAVEDAGSIATLGRERRGSGVVIGADGLVLTVGYLILEADHVDLVVDAGHRVPARVVAYDLATGFGLLQALAPLAIEPAPFGNSATISATEPLVVASGGDESALSLAHLVSRRAFTGYWEYSIEGALFTAPARGDHSGAALFNARGELLGIGSLVVADARGTGQTPLQQGNMFLPIDLLKPILGELRAHGASHDSRRAWLGLNCVEYHGQIRVFRLTPASPAEAAGLMPGDRIVAIDGVAVNDLASFYKTLWQHEPERQVRLEIRRGGLTQTLLPTSVDRMKTLRHPAGI